MSEDISDLQDLFRSTRGQSLQTPTDKPKQRCSYHRNDLYPSGVEVPQQRRFVTSDKYQSFLDKYDDLERFIDGFTTQDLMYYFREKAKEAGYKYVIANMKRDMGIFKKLSANYSPREIAVMIEFIFFSNQDYLEKDITQPTVLSSSYVNTIYHDAMLWVDDKYVPGQKKERKRLVNVKKREWNNKPTTERAKIGEWDK